MEESEIRSSVGRSIGRYEIVGELGRGGMGVVYKARDEQLSRFVALKALPEAAASDADRRRRFLQEARSASSLAHPNIITIHDIVREGGADWIVMELVEGHTLDELIPAGGLAVERALGWAADVADGLAAAHAAGIVHRDLKPSNLMVDSSGRIRVLDFGLAKLELLVGPETQDPTPTSPLTRSGAVLGTLEYMSPEQAMGRPADARSDVFSLGAVLYEMLTGRRPFSGENAPAKIHAVVYDTVVPPGEVRPEVSAEVSALVLTALAKDPQERFQSTAEMATALRAALEPRGREDGARRLPGASPVRRLLGGRATRRQLAITGVAAAAVVGVAFLAARLASGPPAGSTEGSALSPSRPAAQALPATPFRLRQESAELLAHYWRTDYVDQAIDRLQRALAIDPRYAPAYAGLAEASLRKYEEQRDSIWLTRARAQAQQAMAIDASLTAARLQLGLVLLAAGEAEAAERELQEVVVRDPASAEAWRGLADLASADGRKENAEALYRKAVELAPDDPEQASALGAYLFDEARYEEAAEAFTRSIELADDFVNGRSNLAAALHMMGRYDRAAVELQKALELRPDPAAYSNLGTLYFFQALYPQALAAFQRAIELGANDYLVWANLGDAYRWSPGHEQDAQRAYTRALQLLGEGASAKEDDPVVDSRRALLLAKRGAHSAATSIADRLVPQSTDASILYRCALAYELSARRRHALAALAKAIQYGASTVELRQDPELTALREDPEYHLMLVDSASGGADPAGRERP